MPYRPTTVTGQLIAHIINDVIDDEQDDRHHDGHAQSSLTDDGSQRCTNEEEDETSQRQGKFLHQLNLVTADNVVIIVNTVALELHVLHRGGSAHQGLVDKHLLVRLG